MHSSRYYRKLEEEGKSGQGDLGEGLILPNKCIYQCPDYAIFCLCFIDGSTIIDGIVEINEKLVNDFMHENGYIVCIDFNRFILSLKRCDVKMIHDKVKYGFCSYFSIEAYNLL